MNVYRDRLFHACVALVGFLSSLPCSLLVVLPHDEQTCLPYDSRVAYSVVPRFLLAGDPGPVTNDYTRLHCNVVNRRYRYIADLPALDQCRPSPKSRPGKNPVAGDQGCRPRKLSNGKVASSPTRTAYWLARFYRASRKGSGSALITAKWCADLARRNMRSAKEHQAITTRLVSEELARYWLVDRAKRDTTSQISPCDVIPKSHQPRK